MSDFGFGSEIADQVICDELTGLSAVTDAVGGNITGLTAVTQGIILPAVMFYPEDSTYDPPAFGGDNIGMEGLRYVVRLVCKGSSTQPIKAAALAQRRHFNGEAFDATDDGHNYLVSFDAKGAFPMTSLVVGGDVYRQLGTIYNVTVTFGG